MMIASLLPAFAQPAPGAAQQRAAAQRFLAHRGLRLHAQPAASSPRPGGDFARVFAQARAERRSALQSLAARVPPGRGNAGNTLSDQGRLDGKAQQPASSLAGTWHAIGPLQTTTAAYGAVTGRVTSLAVDAFDASGNTVYAGTLGGGVWKSVNAAGNAAAVTFTQISDDVTASSAGIGSQSIGAITVQPGGTGVVLAGTGDPNDALDSYYGSGILRSTDNGATWNTISGTAIDWPASPVSFFGEGFSGFAWSSVMPNLVVAAVTQSYDGAVVNASQTNSVEGMYYSMDAGATWLMGTLTDGPGKVFQSPLTTSGGLGNAATAVVWNTQRQQFIAAIRFHGYYNSPDGITWTRLANQPGSNLSPDLCPTRSGSLGSLSCPLFRGALAVQPSTGDTFAITVNVNLQDQGLWQDMCAATGSGGCSTGTAILFGTQIADAALDDASGNIVQGDYNLWLAAVPAGADTLLFAGTQDIFKRSLAAGNVPWRNTTNGATCAAAQVSPAQHAVASGAGSVLFFGNDGGLWRTMDAIHQQQPACSSDDAAHFQNLNGSLGSLAEITSLSQTTGSAATLLVGEGANGTAGSTTEQGSWPQVLDGSASYVAIDPANPANWYASAGPGVSIGFCGSGGACRPASFGLQPIVGDPQTDSDGESLQEAAVWMLDPQSTTSMIVGTCRIWRGSLDGGVAIWDAGNAISPVLGSQTDPDCTEGAGQIQSLGASGTLSTLQYGPGTSQEILYAGMEGTLTGGGNSAGHLYTASVNAAQAGPALWTDLYASPVINDFSNQHQFNPGGYTLGFGVSSVVVDRHDPSGRTVYATIQGSSGNGIGEPLVYRSTNQGQSWINITANLPDTPVNALVVDPGDAGTVYLATDAGVYVTTAVTTCSTGLEVCWSPYGIGLPDAPVTALSAGGPAGSALLVAGTYGRGAWELPLASACDGTVALGSIQLGGPADLVFGNQPVGSSTSMTVSLTNTGVAPLCVSAVEVSDGFTEQDSCTGVVLPPSATCALTVVFAPSAAGVFGGLLSVVANVPGGSVTKTVSGTGVASAIQLDPAQLLFAPQLVGSTSGLQQVTLSNTAPTPGGAAVSLQPPVITGTDFKIRGFACVGSQNSLAPQQGCTIGVVFSPSGPGPLSGVLSVATGAGTFRTQLSGTGQVPATDTPSVLSLNFAAQTVGSASGPQFVTITNSGDAPLVSVMALSTATDFVVNASGCATDVPGHQSCSLAVTFDPTAPGLRRGTLVISDSVHSGASAPTILLSGTGLAPAGAASLLPQSLAFSTQGLGSTSTAQMVTLTNNGSVPLNGITFAAAGNFAVTPVNCGTSLAVASTCTVSVTFTPSATGSRAGSLTAYAGNLPQGMVVALSGNGLDFTISVQGAAARTVVTGTPATYAVSIAGVDASYGGLSLACSSVPVLPGGSSCTLNPASVSLTEGVNGYATVSVVTPALAVSELGSPDGWPDWKWMLAFVLPLWGFRLRLPKVSALLGGILLLVASTSILNGCGTSATGGPSTQSTGTTGGTGTAASYVLTVAATAPGVTHAVTMTLNLEQ